MFKMDSKTTPLYVCINSWMTYKFLRLLFLGLCWILFDFSKLSLVSTLDAVCLIISPVRSLTSLLEGLVLLLD